MTGSLQLAPNFKLYEFTRSRTARRMGLDNAPLPQHLDALRILASAMQTIRDNLGGRVIDITSGYRSPAVNKAVGGVETSHHALGYAADFTVEGMRPDLVTEAVAGMALRFDQLILEWSRGVNHISVHPRMRGEVLSQPGGPGTPVRPGIHTR